ncbi:2-C-methyl-D-erythritol 4-phosphate cytidylyltransferase [Sulfuricaulis limicola]|uniref:2-C-methyl-D-erythritol 4-phosphate cytidylyltransferase n=2 Tax=Sulfuricaulis limicola TaxID=1620215 RepID=A0A1B4XFG9_9GAMM|nr:2-C-methyl-D-erythritol 4-phosphate cytidylyltransferase [Sulfuricaulis limicola]
MQSAVPKQYLPLLGRPVILHTIERLCAHPRIQGIVIGVAPDDPHWPSLVGELKHLSKFLGTAPGGETRAQTVLNSLKELTKHARPDDWVLVHDAVRPCVRQGDIDKLISVVTRGHSKKSPLPLKGGEGEGEGVDGGLLAFPVSDTVKRVDNTGRVTETVSREGLWRAATPQMFRIKALTHALEQAMKTGKEITDEASAMEAAGGHPHVVACHTDNIKITLLEDLALAELYMQQQRGKA